MSTAADPKQAVIRRTHGTAESSHDRLVKKHVPAWVISGGVHVLIVAAIFAYNLIDRGKTVSAESNVEIAVAPEDREDETKHNLIEETIGIDPDTIPAIDAEKLADQNIVDVVPAKDNPGNETNRQQDLIPPPGAGNFEAGVTGEAGSMVSGEGGLGALGLSDGGLAGRGAATRSKLVGQGGGNSASEAAVARGLAWLAKQQRTNGGWVWDGSNRADSAAATGLALLPFLAAGQTHKPAKDNKYRKTVEDGLKFIVANQKSNGSWGTAGMYAHAITTVALCEALGMTGDRSFLMGPAQKAINFIQQAQGTDGSWGYSANATGDTSIVGWQIQALHSAKLCKELVVDKRVIERANRFLDSVASGSSKGQYGYRTPGATPTLTSVGLLCRYYEAGWGPNHPGMTDGVKYIMNSRLPQKGRMDMYYYYYATQVIHFFEGPEWHKEWNPKMRDMLIELQVAQDKPNAGSWDPEGDTWMGAHTGRVGMTCMCLLTLEVYYRHLPLYKRDAGGLKELDRVR